MSNALLGTKRGSPRVVPDETKPAITDRASRASAITHTLGEVVHCGLLLALSGLFVDHPLFTIALHERLRFSDRLKRRLFDRSADLVGDSFPLVGAANQKDRRGGTSRDLGTQASLTL
jgi:hypothetical protein